LLWVAIIKAIKTRSSNRVQLKRAILSLTRAQRPVAAVVAVHVLVE